jgi:hypothetical protein
MSKTHHFYGSKINDLAFFNAALKRKFVIPFKLQDRRGEASLEPKIQEIALGNSRK